MIETHGEDIREHLFRYLLSDMYKLGLITDESSPHFRLLKENAVFSAARQQDSRKLEAMISFSLALVQFAKSDVACKADISYLFDRLELDPFDKMVFTLPLFSGGVKDEISQQGKSMGGKCGLGAIEATQHTCV